MGLGSVGTTASAGLRSAGERLEGVAVARASGGADVGDLATGATDMVAARVQMSASVAVMRASNEMLGTLLDIMA